MPFDFRITRYASDEEVQHLAELVKDKGTDALRRDLTHRGLTGGG